MKLKQLIQGISFQAIHGSKEKEISGISADSRRVAPGYLFVARRGERVDGAQFIPQAVQTGAGAVVTALYNPFLPGVTQLVCARPEEVEAALAVRFYRNPSRELRMVGVTGTKGKTTSTYLVRHLLERLGGGCGLSGTIETIVGERRYPSPLTTLDAISHQKLLREVVSAGQGAAVLEVSSHGLMQRRTEGIEWDAALWTNLAPDHLDYHGTVEEYAAAKRRLLLQVDESPKKQRVLVLNGDDGWCRRMAEGLQSPVRWFGMGQIGSLRSLPGRTEFVMDGELFSVPMIGRFNIYNFLGAIAIGLHFGYSLKAIREVMADAPPVPGRLEAVPNGRGVAVFVDYAHTKEALEQTLRTIREMGVRRLGVVFGCGGNRDPQRRTGMAAAAEENADFVMVTSDNPRRENPEEIGRQILAGFRQPERVRMELDRREAIRQAILSAEPGDALLIAGKGHEKMQIFANQTLPFDDVEVAKEYL